jgi:hypothetical protein
LAVRQVAKEEREVQEEEPAAKLVAAEQNLVALAAQTRCEPLSLSCPTAQTYRQQLPRNLRSSHHRLRIGVRRQLLPLVQRMVDIETETETEPETVMVEQTKACPKVQAY